MERFLAARFPEATRIGALWEPDYDPQEWAGFLTALGYHQFAATVFAKPLPPPAAAP